MQKMQFVAPVLLLILGCGGGDEKSSDSGPGLHAGNPAVRACDMVLKLDDADERTVKFPDHVIGSYFQRGARLGVAVISKKDEALGKFTKGLGDEVSVAKSTCFDRAGRPVDDPRVSMR